MPRNPLQHSPNNHELSGPKSPRSYSKGLLLPTACQQDSPVKSVLEGRNNTVTKQARVSGA